VADGTKAAAKSGIGSTIKKKDTVVMGAPAFDLGEYRRSFVLFKRLPELYGMLKDAQVKIEELLKTK
jgi:UDP-3-O-[3-hydroxymyristoyl] glucosamine N-acyltransferase